MKIVPPAALPARLVLINGLFMGRHVMRFLGARLGRAGYDVEYFSYNTITGSLGSAAAQLAKLANRDPRPVTLVGHSLGGLVSLQASQLLSPTQMASIVLLGSPYQGAAAARMLRSFTGGPRSPVGKALSDWTALDSKPRAPVPVFTLAGTRSAGLGRLLCGFREPNDGTVAVAETHYPGATACLLPVSHTGMLFSRDVATQVSAWLTAAKA